MASFFIVVRTFFRMNIHVCELRMLHVYDVWQPKVTRSKYVKIKSSYQERHQSTSWIINPVFNTFVPGYFIVKGIGPKSDIKQPVQQKSELALLTDDLCSARYCAVSHVMRLFWSVFWWSDRVRLPRSTGWRAQLLYDVILTINCHSHEVACWHGFRQNLT